MRYDFGPMEGAGQVKSGRHSEEQMVAAVKQMEAGRTAAEIGREIGVSKHTL